MNISQLEAKSKELRKEILEMCIKAGTGHVTSSVSCIDVLVALYYGGVLRYNAKDPQWKERDRFILSKGQASPALYNVLADVGFFSKRKLDRFAQEDGIFGVHLQNDVPGVEITSGSLGQGFGIAAGLALGARLNRELYMTIALLGDGECYEGSIWETAMFASHHRLNNLVAIVDRNYLCATDFTENLISLEPLDARWASFGWEVKRIDGHCMADILRVLAGVKSRTSTSPLVVIADTVKGMGIESMCYDPLWHAVAPQGAAAGTARECLERWCNHE